MCSPKGYGFSAGLGTNNILVDLGLFGHNRVWFRFLHSSLDMGMFISHHYRKDTITYLDTVFPSVH